MKILVCGGRNYNNWKLIEAVLDKAKPTLIITGGANGADRLAGRWAKQMGIPLMQFPAPWGALGVSAGPIRNGWMLKFGKPNLVIAFPGGTGTANMVAKARGYGIPVEKQL